MRGPAFWWKREVCRTGCVMCAAFPVDKSTRQLRRAQLENLQAHHVLARRHLKREGKSHLDWADGNGICLCEYHHFRHENAIQRVPFDLLPQEAVEFAEYVGLPWVLEREYARDEQ